MKKSKRPTSKRSGRLTGLITRVSLDKAALNPEGSLVNQLQRLRSHLKYKFDTSGDVWPEASHYKLRGVSGKNSVRSPEFQQLFDDVRAGKIDVGLVTARDRVCRSVSDFLTFFEFLNEHGVQFVSLREGFDTTTHQGKLQAVILMALAEFERAITAQRTSEAMFHRAERGLWNGGQLLGYDLDSQRRGYLIPNAEEGLLVNLAFDLYLELGSITDTAEELNRRGYRTKSYDSRRGKHHPGSRFRVSSTQYVLKNVAYIGKKDIAQSGESGEERRLVDAVWEPIIDGEKFELVQRLMADNGQIHRNGASSIQHVYLLGGLIYCKRCGSKMDGDSGTGRIGKEYY